MYADKAHARLVASRWLPDDTGSYHLNHSTKRISLTPIAPIAPSSSAERRLLRQRSGPYLLRSGRLPLVVFDCLPAASTALLAANAFHDN